MKKAPKGMTEDHFQYLDDLRESGRTNMWGAARYLTDEMEVSNRDAGEYLMHWMETFEDRHSV